MGFPLLSFLTLRDVCSAYCHKAVGAVITPSQGRGAQGIFSSERTESEKETGYRILSISMLENVKLGRGSKGQQKVRSTQVEH